MPPQIPPGQSQATLMHFPKSSRRALGFTLVEIMIVVVIIGLLAAMGLPALKRVTVRSQATTVVNNLRQFDAALQQYSLETGGWPPDALSGSLPAGMSSTNFPTQVWLAGVKGGGIYDWDYNVDSITAGIVILMDPSLTSNPVWAEVDRIIDDGNTATGNFFLVADNRYKLIVQR